MFFVPPQMDWDVYKFLGGADALLHDEQLPALFRDLVSTDGALHAVPGYSYMVAGLWGLLGRCSIPAVLAMNVAISACGYAAGADLARRWFGPLAGAAVLFAFAMSPPLAFLEALPLPDALTAPVLLMVVWIATVAGERFPLASALFAGTLAAANTLVRATSQAFAPIPCVVVCLLGARTRRTRVVWCAAYLLAYVAAVSPWCLHNWQTQGVWRVTGSSGRQAFFSAAWTNTIDRAEWAARLGVTSGAPVFPTASAFPITEEAFQSAFRRTQSIAAADSELMQDTIDAYRARPLGEILKTRSANLLTLFASRQDGDLAAQMQPLVSGRESYEKNRWQGAAAARVILRAYKQVPSDDFLAGVTAAAAEHSATADAFVRWWIDHATLDGLPLLLLYAVALAVAAARRNRPWPALWAFAFPPLAFLALFSVFGTPVYRYQVGIHVFFYLSAAGLLATSSRAAEARSAA